MLAHNAKEQGHADASAEAGPWTVTLDAPVLLPLLQHAQNRELRQRVQEAYVTRASEGDHDNKPLIRQILTLRQELAKLLGFATYADLSVDQKMAPSVAAVDALLDDLVDAATPKAAEDLKAMEGLAAADGITEGLRAWDTAYYAERRREQELELNEEALRAYFPQSRVLEGLFQLLDDAFDVKVVAADGQAPLWHPDVRFFHIRNKAGETIAGFYLDAYARPGMKRAGAWMNGIFSRSNHLPGGMQMNGKRLPVAVLVTNVAPPADGQESLLSFREVETLFHECGHGLQHMLTTIDCAMTAGISKVEWDAVELPSQFMEQWCYHPPVLRSISAHFESGEALPEAEVERLLQARTFNQGILTLRQCSLARVDLRLHHGFQPQNDADAIALQQRVSSKILPVPPEAYDHFLCQGDSKLFRPSFIFPSPDRLSMAAF
jgi:oligopeptidase A